MRSSPSTSIWPAPEHHTATGRNTNHLLRFHFNVTRVDPFKRVSLLYEFAMSRPRTVDRAHITVILIQYSVCQQRIRHRWLLYIKHSPEYKDPLPLHSPARSNCNMVALIFVRVVMLLGQHQLLSLRCYIKQKTHHTWCCLILFSKRLLIFFNSLNFFSFFGI